MCDIKDQYVIIINPSPRSIVSHTLPPHTHKHIHTHTHTHTHTLHTHTHSPNRLAVSATGHLKVTPKSDLHPPQIPQAVASHIHTHIRCHKRTHIWSNCRLCIENNSIWREKKAHYHQRLCEHPRWLQLSRTYRQSWRQFISPLRDHVCHLLLFLKAAAEHYQLGLPLHFHSSFPWWQR